MEECLAIRRALGDAVGVAVTRCNLAEVVRRAGEYTRAEALLEEAVALERAQGATLNTAVSLVGLGQTAFERGDLAPARRLLEEAHARFIELGGTRDLAACLEGLGQVACAEGEFERTTTLCAAAAVARRAKGTPLPPIDRGRYERTVTDARRALGAGRFAELWAEGAAMTLDEAIALELRASGTSEEEVEEGEGSGAGAARRDGPPPQC
jgi:tetratricopeptide (TPR) repeat protein